MLGTKSETEHETLMLQTAQKSRSQSVLTCRGNITHIFEITFLYDILSNNTFTLNFDVNKYKNKNIYLIQDLSSKCRHKQLQRLNSKRFPS